MAGFALKEWPLIGFTLLSQTAVGAFWMVTSASIYAEGANGWNSRYLTFPFLAAVVALMAAAAAISLFHLGRPRRAVLALNNLKQSWLSREVLFGLAFMALAAVLALLVFKKTYHPTLIRILVGLGIAASILFLASMSKLYMLRTVPAWRGLYTPLSFFGSALLMGPLGVASSYDVLLDLGRRVRPIQDAAAVIALAAIVVILLTIFLFSPGVGLFGPKKATLLELPTAKMYLLLIIRLLFLLAVVLCSYFYYQNQDLRLLTLAFLAAGAAEVSGRCLFYAVYSRLGV